MPLSSAAREVIASLPRIKGGKYLFSLSGGKRPLSMTGPVKADLDQRMLRTLQAMARRRGEDHEQVTLPHWVNHDLRRTVRSGLSALRVASNVAEAVLAHRQGGISATYDLHEYQMIRPRRWSYGRSASRPSSTRSLLRPARSSRCASGGADRRRGSFQR